MSRPVQLRDQFVASFVASWRALLAEVSESQLLSCFNEPSAGGGRKHPWTRCMVVAGGVGKPDWPTRSVVQNALLSYGENLGLTRVAERIRWEESRLDVVLAGGDAAAWKGTFEFGWPASIAAIVEHERGADFHTEIWKLLFWRADLKVLICYDRGAPSPEPEALSPGFDEYFDRCRRMVAAARAADNGFAPETLLVLVGRQLGGSAPISSWIQLTFDSTQAVEVWSRIAATPTPTSNSPPPPIAGDRTQSG